MSRLLPPRNLVAMLITASSMLSTGGARSATASKSVSPDDPHAVTRTLLPDIADRMLRVEGVEPLPFAKLTSTKNHLGDTNDCLSCHKPDGTNKLPRDHATTKEHEGWPLQSCERCHLRESKLRNATTGSLATNFADNGYCLSCHSDVSLKMRFTEASDPVSLHVSRKHFASSVHGKQKLACVGCHGVGTYPHAKLNFRNSREFARSVERESCMVCHPAQADQFRKSVHGRAYFERNSADVPGCTDCHGSHATSRTQLTSFKMGMTETCGGCHSNPSLAAKYKMSADVVGNYRREFHGATIRIARSEGSTIASNKPVCHDCHGAHDITKTTDSDARISKARRVHICQKCHEGAGPKFADAWMGHAEPNLRSSPIVYFTKLGYQILIPAVMGQFGLYMLFDLLRWRLNRVRKRRPS